jgi:hypothetical protein
MEVASILSRKERFGIPMVDANFIAWMQKAALVLVYGLFIHVVIHLIERAVVKFKGLWRRAWSHMNDRSFGK